jgi:hypothetical protein
MRPRGGFTAEELIAVLGIIVLLAVGFFWVTRNVTGMTRMTSCASNIRQLHHASRMYMADYAGRMPHEDAIPAALQPYTKNEQIYRCPTVEVETRRRGERRDYGWDEGDFPTDYDFAPWVQADDPAETLLVRDDAPRHVSRTWLAARLDGAVQRYDADEFDLIWRDGPPEMGGELPDEASN